MGTLLIEVGPPGFLDRVVPEVAHAPATFIEPVLADDIRQPKPFS